MTTTPVIFETLASANGKKLGLATLNVEKTLNSLSLEVVDLLLEQLGRWQDDAAIAAVVLQSSGEKAFCAGGDMQAMYHSATDKPDSAYAETFFEREYRLDYLIHRYKKPVVCWGHGIVMGGGVGLMLGCSHRIVTEKTRIAMPEVTIALFPDVGASYFLNQMPGECGRFLALTAVSINAADSLYLGVADCFIEQQYKSDIVGELAQLVWVDDAKDNAALISGMLQRWHRHSANFMPPGEVEPLREQIDALSGGATVTEVYGKIMRYDGDNEWLLRGKAGLSGGSPLAACWIFKHLEDCKDKTLADVFRRDLILATNIVRHSEFVEGVRALLIDKDKNPQWQYRILDAVPTGKTDPFFAAPWARNPLADLGE